MRTVEASVASTSLTSALNSADRQPWFRIRLSV